MTEWAAGWVAVWVVAWGQALLKIVSLGHAKGEQEERESRGSERERNLQHPVPVDFPSPTGLFGGQVHV